MPVRAVYAVNTGDFRIPHRFVVGGESLELVRMPVLIFVIVTDGGAFLVDAGGRRGRFMRWNRALGLYRAGPERELWEQLERLDLRPVDIQAWILTHLDVDHTGALPELPSVPAYVAGAAIEHARHPNWHERLTGRFCRSEIEALEQPVAYEFESRDLNLGPFTQGWKVPAVDGVTTVSLPGHAGGHAGVLVCSEEGGRILLCGDAVISQSQLTDRELGLFSHIVAHEVASMEETVEGLRKVAEAHPSLPIIPSHDPGIGAAAANGPYEIPFSREERK